MVFGKRIDKPGGARRAVRDEMMIRAAIMTTTESVGVDLLDLSRTGARVRGSGLPAPGQEVVVLLGRLEAFGSVVWRDEEECGIHFDVQLSELAVATVQAERGPTSLRSLRPDERLAAGEWFAGLAR